MKVKKLSEKDGKILSIDNYPNFHCTGNVIGMKQKFYGKNALLVKCGNYIYNVTANPDIYHNWAS
jgi:hypothetical protein